CETHIYPRQDAGRRRRIRVGENLVLRCRATAAEGNPVRAASHGDRGGDRDRGNGRGACAGESRVPGRRNIGVQEAGADLIADPVIRNGYADGKTSCVTAAYG